MQKMQHEALKIDRVYDMTQKDAQVWGFTESLVRIQEAILSFCERVFLQLITNIIYE